MSDEEVYFLEKQFLEFQDFECDEGWILDFGGGGEGVIGQVKGTQVISIDRRMGEAERSFRTRLQSFVSADGWNRLEIS